MPAESNTDPVLAAMNALLREREAESLADESFAAWLEAHEMPPPDKAAMLRVGTARFGVYRKLVHNRMRNAIRDFIPRSLARLGRERFRRDFADFMHERAARSPYLRDVPAEFVAFAGPRWGSDDQVPRGIADLARHELLEFDVRNDPRGGEDDTGAPLALDRPLRFDGSARLMDYEHAVHRVSVDEADTTPISPGRTHLLVYRDARGKVRYLELTAFARAVLERLLGHGDVVEGGLRQACESLGVSLDDEHLATAAQLLADLADRRVMLGAEI